MALGSREGRLLGTICRGHVLQLTISPNGSEGLIADIDVVGSKENLAVVLLIQRNLPQAYRWP